MDTGALLLMFFVVVVVGLFVFWPFIKRERIHAESDHEVSSLLAERDRLLSAIEELDFDHALGKIPVEEYPLQRKTLLQAGAEVLRQLDSVIPTNLTIGDMDGSANLNLSDMVVQSNGPISDEDLEEMIARRRVARKEKTSGFCPRCGKPVLQSDRFCACCGEPMQVPE